MDMFTTGYQMLQTLDNWSSQTFGDQYLKFKSKKPDLEVLELTNYLLDMYSLKKKRMDGSLANKKHPSEKEFSLNILFIHFFNELQESDEEWTPFDIVRKIAEYVVQNKSYFEDVAEQYDTSMIGLAMWMCGRTLRAFPSFVRECQLKNAIQSRLPGSIIEQNEVIDSQEKCDLRLVWNNNTYNIWSFVNTEFGVCKFAYKMLGKKKCGIVPNGLHLVCPTSLNECSYKNWKLYSKRDAELIVNKIKNCTNPIDYNDFCKKLKNKDYYGTVELIQKTI